MIFVDKTAKKKQYDLTLIRPELYAPLKDPGSVLSPYIIGSCVSAIFCFFCPKRGEFNPFV